MKIKTEIIDGTRYHIINDVSIECNGSGCKICEGDTEISFQLWENSIPFPTPPKGKRYKNSLFQKNRGKTIMEICYTCKDIPCYICRRTKCDQWMKEKLREGQEEGCVHWQNGRCVEFSCEYGLIKSRWEDFSHAKEDEKQ